MRTCPSSFVNYFFVGIAVIVVLAIGGSFYLAYLRRKALSELAASMGLPFNETGPDCYLLAQAGLEIFSIGRSRKASNLIEMRGAGSSPDISFFDYRYTTGSGKNRHAHNFTIALFDFKTTKIPAFELKPETFLYKIGELIGFKDIDIPASPLFSDKYRLTGPNEAEVLSFFHPGAVAYLEQHLGWCAQGAGSRLAVFKGERLVKPDAYQGFMEEARALASSVVR